MEAGGLNYGQMCRALDAVVDLGDGELKDETPVMVYVNGAYKELISIYPEELNGKMVVVAEAGI